MLDLRLGRTLEIRGSIGGFIAAVVSDIVPKMKKDPTDTGGYFGVFDLATGLPLLVFPVGTFPNEEKAQRHLTDCMEKATRLSLMFRESGHLTSWQSRDPDNMPTEHRARFGGAVSSLTLIFSFSGFSEHADELISVVAAEINDPVDYGYRQRVGEISNNPYLLALSK